LEKGNELFSGNSKFSGTPMNDPHLYRSAPQYATITRVEEKEGEKASLSRRMRWGVIVSWFSVFMRNFKAIL